MNGILCLFGLLVLSQSGPQAPSTTVSVGGDATDGIIEVLTSREYQYFSSEKPHDFGPVTVNGTVSAALRKKGRKWMRRLE
jgi:hypothetical protein